ncbi:hypothetical protein S7335_162 [Synechococcus sp. PCC 7335]|nr:hypothetical protein S7335_140 [Synechococcus sp. PCC 7335]EDX82984.1 hypothetical protein S7335_162 [Synechococcus sp. PCC 7335]
MKEEQERTTSGKQYLLIPLLYLAVASLSHSTYLHRTAFSTPSSI